MSSSPGEPVGQLPGARDVTAAEAALDGILAGCPTPSRRSPRQREAVAAARGRARDLKDAFLRTYVDQLYDEVTDGRRRFLRLDGLCAAAAAAVPGLVPTPARSDAELLRPPAEKEGLDVDQSILVSHVLRSDRAGPHLLAAMRRPTRRAGDLLPELLRTGTVELRSVRVEVRDGAAHLTMRRDDCLNAEDNEQVEDMETAVDLALLAPSVRVGVLRGGVMTHPRYAGRRVFSAGINLKCLHAGRISYLGFLLRRELGCLAKLVHGLSGGGDDAWDGGAVQKPWIAAVDAFAIGGGAQILLACDRVIAERGAYFSLPAAQEGIIPGAGNLRLGRVVGGRLSRQIVLAGQRVSTDEPAAGLLFDEVVPADRMDAAIAREVARMDSPAVVANRRMLNLAEEPQTLFRLYLAEFAVQQARRLYSEDVLDKVTRFSTGPLAGAPAG
ncbi:(3,5-dihydroxyphenyl)acetyl-CoA 1,2-dioxygenase DpgC [Micromonospora rifamycinica]|uniref:(3,5-dihydroxyphenyl)acetyl-CoA 1,2-dioxygenase DpgC n=1 Tax=Micromonospora rifamycinica TaxID=291594 RepID=UPI0033F4A7D9